MEEGVAPSPTTRSMRARNRRQLLDLLRENGALSQAEIARKTGLSRTTISTLVAELRGLGLLVEAESGRPDVGAQGGRPPVMLALDDSAGTAVGVDVGHGHLRVAVANLARTVLAEHTRELDVGEDAARALDVAAEMVADALAESGVDSARVIGVGLGLPGPIDRARGVVASGSILPGWRGVRAADELSTRVGLPVGLDNDANLAALAETLWGGGQGCGHVVYVKMSTRIGCGLIVDGWLFRGARGIAGEIGHMVVNESGPVCYCGSRGCLETVASASAIADLLRLRHGDQLTLAQVVALAVEGDTGCQRALTDISGEVGIAVGNVCNLLNPERVVVGGTLSQAGELVLDPIRQAVHRATRQFTTEMTAVVPARLGDRAEVLGALALVMRDASKHFSLRLGASL
ncbi:MAG TPA: ROK family protein [Candidatus Dormibacteraeota bacterium]|nr:ROK family protein [Candidatus Dormibacteraeota bacterium]